MDLQRSIVIDMVAGNRAAGLRRWTSNADPGWLGGIAVVATDLAESFQAGLSPHLDHAIRVADPFHVARVGNRCLGKVRRRVQNETLGYRGRRADPLFRIRKLLASGSERLDARGADRKLLGLRAGNSDDEVLGAWLAKTLASWGTEILAHLHTGASNCPTEGLNLCVKKVKRSGPRVPVLRELPLRVLLHAGGVTWPTQPYPPRIRTRTPHSNGLFAMNAG